MAPGRPDGNQLRELATAHAVALRLRRGGASDETIAAALGIDADAVPTLVEVAELKLAALEQRRDGADGDRRDDPEHP